MGPGGGEVTIKKRKVIYDDYTGGFYAESKVESLQRMCDYRARLTEVLNKAEEARYRFTCKQVDAEKNLFLMKKDKAANKHAENLNEHKAHMNVLEKLARERTEAGGEDDSYGKYPRGSLRNNIDDLIENEIKEMKPDVKRKREATKLLLKRTELIVPDRTLTTDEMFDELKSRKSRATSPAKSHDVRKSMPQLILPAISVRLNRNGERTKMADAVTISKAAMDRDKPKLKATNKVNSNALLPSVFVTDVKGFSSPS